MNIASFVGLAGGLLGLVGLISAALVVARSSIAKGTITLLEGNQSALKSRLETVEAENRLLNDRIHALEHTKDELFQQVKSTPEFIKITEELAAVNDVLLALFEETRAIKDSLRNE